MFIDLDWRLLSWCLIEVLWVVLGFTDFVVWVLGVALLAAFILVCLFICCEVLSVVGICVGYAWLSV